MIAIRRTAAGMSMTSAATMTATTAASGNRAAVACAVPRGLRASNASLGTTATRTLGDTSASVFDSVGCQICLGTTPGLACVIVDLGLACVIVDFGIATNDASDAFF